MKHFFQKNKLRLVVFVAAALLLCALGAVILLTRHQKGSATALNDLQLSIGQGASTRVLSLWRQNQPEDGDEAGNPPEDGWFFLPAYADSENLRLLYDDSRCTVLLDGQRISSGARLPAVVNGGQYTLSFVDSIGSEEVIPLHFVQSQNLAALFIDTQTGSMADIRADKAYQEAAAMKLVLPNGKVDYNGALEYLSGRGNQTWQLDKRGYGFKLARADRLLGMESAKKWVLLANAFDDSMLRNTLAYDMADALGLACTPQSDFCDLYLNGVYAGTYQLCEKVEIDENRVDVTDLEQANRAANSTRPEGERVLDTDTNTAWVDLENSPADLTGGYLIERDYGDKYADENAWLTTDEGEVFVVKAPANATRAEVDYLDGLLQSLENAIYAPDGIDPETQRAYTDILDLDSWAKLFLIDEFTKNEGAGASSAWYYKDSDSVDSLLYSGPIWDYDKSLGRYSRWTSPQGLALMEYHDHPTHWFHQLYEKPEFYNAVLADYQEQLLPYLQTVLDEKLAEWQQKIDASWSMDHIRWAGYYSWQHYPNDAATLQSCTDYLRSWIEARVDFLNSVWVDGTVYYTVKLDNEMRSTADYYLYVQPGETLDALPEGRNGEGDFLYWVIDGTDTIVDETTPITQDLRLKSVWSGSSESAGEEN